MEDAHIAVANLSEFINNHHIQHNRDLPRESSDVSNDDINVSDNLYIHYFKTL